MLYLTPEQREEVKAELVPMAKGKPVRFQVNGQTMDILTGVLQTKGIPIMHQIVYWRFTHATAVKIADWLRCKAVWDEGESYMPK